MAKWRNAICLALATITVFGTASCAGVGKLSVEDLAVPTYTDNGQTLRMMGTLHPNPTDRTAMETYKAVGFNAIPYAEDFVPAEAVLTEGKNAAYLRGLEVCEELGLDALLRPHNVWVSATPTDEPNYFEKYFSDIDFRDYPAVKGFFVTDEPEYAKLLDLEDRYLTWFNENYGGEYFEFTSNIFGRQSSNWKKGEYASKTYDDYAEKYLSIIEKANSARKLHTIDIYPLHQTEGFKDVPNENVLWAHEDAAARAKAHGFGLHLCVQTFGASIDTLGWKIPSTFAEIDYALNSTLLFGPERLEFFSYRDYKADKLVGMVTDGEPNERYYWTQSAIGNLTKWDHVYRSYKWEHLFTNVGTGSKSATNPAFEMVRAKVKPITGVQALKSKYDIAMSEFKDDADNKAFFLLNYDEPILGRTNKVSITFESAQGVLYYRGGEATTEVLTGGKFEIELNAGEAVFVIPLYKK